MSADTWSAFLLASLVTAFTPGQAILLAISNALERGRLQALISSCGNVAGLFLVAGITSTGLGALMRHTPGALQALKVAGALYLVYLGLQAWRHTPPVRSAAAGTAPALGRRQLFMQGLTVAASNPKSILFFGALFPQFAGSGPGLPWRFAMLTASFAACTLLAHAVYILGARWASGRFKDGVDARLARRCGGVLFVLMGLGMLLA